MRLTHAAIALAVLVGAAGCSASTQMFGPSGSPAASGRASVAQLMARATKQSPLLFIPDNSQVLIYDKNTKTQVGSIQTGIYGPTGLWVNHKGDLYVAN